MKVERNIEKSIAKLVYIIARCLYIYGNFENTKIHIIHTVYETLYAKYPQYNTPYNKDLVDEINL